jgi:hypothetical protein
MSSHRLIVLAITCAALAAPLASQAAPDSATTSASCVATPMTLTERRITEKAAGGLPALIAYVHLTQPIYQVSVDDAVAMIDAQRARKDACTMVSARAKTD